MPRTLSGLVSAEFDSIDVFHSVLVRGSPGQVQTVLTSDGVGCDWAHHHDLAFIRVGFRVAYAQHASASMLRRG